jgi:hypothetical protein
VNNAGIYPCRNETYTVKYGFSYPNDLLTIPTRKQGVLFYAQKISQRLLFQKLFVLSHSNFGIKKGLFCAKNKNKNRMQSTHNQIVDKIKKSKRGKIFFQKDFTRFGTGNAVRHTLSRLCQDGVILRLSVGIYLYPKISDLIGTVYPSIEYIAHAIAKSEKARLIPTGVYALNKLGLSTQVSMRVVFLTDSTPRNIKIGGKTSIIFKKTIPKYLALKGKITTLVIFALKEIGKNQALPEELAKIKSVLAHETKENIRHDAPLAPEWITETIFKLTDNE